MKGITLFDGMNYVQDFIDHAKADGKEPCIMVNLRTGEIQPYLHANNHLFRCVVKFNKQYNPDKPETGKPFYIDDIVEGYKVTGNPDRNEMYFFGLSKVLLYEPKIPKSIGRIVFFMPEHLKKYVRK